MYHRPRVFLKNGGKGCAMITIDHLTCQVLETQVPGWGWVRHLRVQRNDGNDGITWDELQAVKDEFLGADCQAVEIYPQADELVNETNLRHLWEVPAHIYMPNLFRH